MELFSVLPAYGVLPACVDPRNCPCLSSVALVRLSLPAIMPLPVRRSFQLPWSAAFLPLQARPELLIFLPLPSRIPQTMSCLMRHPGLMGHVADAPSTSRRVLLDEHTASVTLVCARRCRRRALGRTLDIGPCPAALLTDVTKNSLFFAPSLTTA